KALHGELIVDELLTVAARPQHSPGRPRRLRGDFRQGFAPFGLKCRFRFWTNHFGSVTGPAPGHAFSTSPATVMCGWRVLRVRGGLFLARSILKAATPLRCVRVLRHVPIVVVEHQTHNLLRLDEAQSLLEELARGPVGRDDDEKPIDPLRDDPTVWDRHD